MWPSDPIQGHRTWSILFQVMACCLMAPSNYLNQCLSLVGFERFTWGQFHMKCSRYIFLAWMMILKITDLTHWGWVTHICVDKLTKPSHYLNQCWAIINWTLRDKLQWNFNQNTKHFIHKNASENIVFEMAAILSRGDELKTCLFPLVAMFPEVLMICHWRHLSIHIEYFHFVISLTWQWYLISIPYFLHGTSLLEPQTAGQKLWQFINGTTFHYLISIVCFLYEDHYQAPQCIIKIS